ncbi:uncharacterized protein LOC124276758 [Haliotis rubra]|uniref:uncharacterized protein LOC124276758 n=1 Tax=Haliotis rubra TaxID=36100 RepID=UPI001EE5115A|nr:uncharacterized protein LOC124276758 [Haliotis rubra]
MHGWHSNQCNHPCSSHCRNNICNQQNGLCAFGCDGSYTGDFCNMTKSTVVTTHATLPTTEASPSEPKTDLVVIIIPIIAIIIILCLVAVVVYIMRKRKKRRKANIESRFQEEVPLVDKIGAEAARPVLGVAQHNPESDPLGQKINNTRTLFVETESFKKVERDVGYVPSCDNQWSSWSR